MTAIESHIEKIAPAVRKLTLRDEQGPLTHAHVLDALHRSEGFAGIFCQMLLAPGFRALFWEMPPLSTKTMNAMFECVVIDSPELARLRCDPGPFSEHFSAGRDVATFTNLGGDACLVAPAPHGEAAYPHLATFCRTAPPAVMQQFWSALAIAVAQRLSEQPLWISTSGLGVGWLHARLDSRPKYYVHQPYRHWR